MMEVKGKNVYLVKDVGQDERVEENFDFLWFAILGVKRPLRFV